MSPKRQSLLALAVVCPGAALLVAAVLASRKSNGGVRKHADSPTLTRPASSRGQPPIPVRFAPDRAPIMPFVGDLNRGVGGIARGLPLVQTPHLSAPLGRRHRRRLSCELRVQSFDGGHIAKAMWEGDLLAGAVADKLAASGLGEIGSVMGTAVRPNGERTRLGGGLGLVVHDQRFPTVHRRSRRRSQPARARSACATGSSVASARCSYKASPSRPEAGSTCCWPRAATSSG